MISCTCNKGEDERGGEGNEGEGDGSKGDGVRVMGARVMGVRARVSEMLSCTCNLGKSAASSRACRLVVIMTLWLRLCGYDFVVTLWL